MKYRTTETIEKFFKLAADIKSLGKGERFFIQNFETNLAISLLYDFDKATLNKLGKILTTITEE